jgi:hypothetical protein
MESNVRKHRGGFDEVSTGRRWGYFIYAADMPGSAVHVHGELIPEGGGATVLINPRIRVSTSIDEVFNNSEAFAREALAEASAKRHAAF